MGDDGRSSRSHRVAPFAWRGLKSSEQPMHKLNIERFEAMVPALTRLVEGFAPDATCDIEKGAHGYFCASWVLGDREARQLFVEQAGRQVTPFDLRVGIYFADSVRATSD